MKAAVRLQAIKEDWEARKADLDDALTYNRKLWTVLVTSVTRPENPLPVAIKQNVANLGLFVFNHSLQVSAASSPDRLTVLININRELAAGLRGMAPPPQKAA